MTLACDLKGLVIIHATLLAATLAFGDGNRSDIIFQFAYLVFLLPGWLLARRWTPLHQPLIVQYAHALITAFSLHGVLMLVGTSAQLGMQHYFVGFFVITAAAFIDRGVAIGYGDRARPLRVTKREILVWVALIVFIVVVYRIPRSNDIGQFIAQQRDYIVTGSLSPSAIGMSGMGVDEAMPRWRANYWHLWPSLMATITRLPLEDVLHRYAPIPLALAAFASLVNALQMLTRQRQHLWAIVLAIVGPILIWYRAYNAFTYSFRIINNFALDKDFCLFVLIPAVVYLTAGWLRGKRYLGIPLLLMIPAIVRFHPMTAVYLTLLLPFVLVGFAPVEVRSSQRRLDLQRMVTACFHPRSLSIIGTMLLILASVVWLGDAQSFHREIHEILRYDFSDYQAGRPLHYWVGHYGSIPELDQRLDTSTWTNGRFHLRWAIISDSGLLVVAHLFWIVAWLAYRRSDGSLCTSTWFAVGLALAMLWLIVLSSYVILDSYPYLLAGMERSHWFAFLPALVSISTGLAILGRCFCSLLFRRNHRAIADRLSIVGSIAITGVLLYSAGCLAAGRSTFLVHVRGIHSRLDYELPDYRQRQANYPHRVWQVDKPSYLRDSDRVLYLDLNGNNHYWLIRQAMFWSEPYAEAFAYYKLSEHFLRDRRHFYDLLDRLPNQPPLRQWLDEKSITLIVDYRDGADEFLTDLKERQSLPLRQLEPGVWRYRSIQKETAYSAETGSAGSS